MAQAAVYIDGGHLIDAVRGMGASLDMDMMALAKGLAGDDVVAAVHFYYCPFPEHPYPTKHRNEKAVMARFEAQGVQVHACRTQVIGSVFVERGMEAALAAQMIPDAMAGRVDRALLISRREDFAAIVAAVREAGTAVEIASVEYTTAPGNPLGDACGGYSIIDRARILEVRKSGPKPAF